MKKHRKKIIFAVILAILLVFSYFWTPDSTPESKVSEDDAEFELVENTPEEIPEEIPILQEPENLPDTEKTEVESEEKNELSCTITIRCDTILNNMDSLEESKHFLIPENGVILEKTEVEFFKGESVFDVLMRETRNNKIHMEFVKSPVYNSAYIEGIHNLYEFDCGELSGWMYSVNGWFPNYGCSDYILKDGDSIEWVYTCDLGKDVQ